MQYLRRKKDLAASETGHGSVVPEPVLIHSQVLFVEQPHLAMVAPCQFVFAYNRNMAMRTEGEDLRSTGAAALRREISTRNLLLASAVEHEITYGETASVVYREDKQGEHGNFFPASYRRVVANPHWARRLGKTYTASHRIARGHEHERAELDCANSSDALLMNIFCAPSTMRSARLSALLGVERGALPSFGVRVRTPLRDGHDDRTEVDMQCGDLLVEAKLSETGFQTARPDLMARYEAFEEVFDTDGLPRTRGQFRAYQLLRGIMAAHHHGTRYAVFCDARRPDLREEWFAVLSAVHSAELRSRLLLVTWQEIAGCLSRPLKNFLAVKYGIEAR